ncbi:tRNA (N(6)-L-threonylcarbamoyladenosine(37)-C(2))-methylthiotransferase MtaB [Varunaivibrio sulfuroxidans]|uniref:Threonylcarbamoyladenosine tRNA methylthiotransferase MtaB n=1 Tax=Varunaivibrio sulfuroxidans TaxID=1773489 RepID=A0A4R3JC59_9PROT|nr:tRNA (N(6)-L-threonylcarbamoyladenosine(37)-C(2))-methylthiotransferase MtaB [Varunaivibrio sulfuroxidans]TCS63629.1 threonylcarbamoyladenosine tRNA methylthiotransferase MtaB [Varunaivibrio sulfuroxidans]WES30231.1 tRNA (N(6)-L-threonylcarbamoyladenosine(37)-C(2))-methylthiotransferase MtaB [Varunaivibrio sulfuroxidans]
MVEPEVITLGCRLNTLESEMMRDQARRGGARDTVIVNTCAVTREAERQARQTIRKIRRERPDAKIIVTGCAAQLSPETFADMAEVDRVVGNREKLSHATLLGNDATGVAVSDIMADEVAGGPLVSGIEGRTRAFVQIQQGCDHRCTFCIIPFARGPNRAVDAARIVEQVRLLAAGGHQEVVLTGVDISSYGAERDNGPTLAHLVRTILHDVPSLKRLRLSSLDPDGIDDDLARLFAEDARMMPHVHLSLQACDDMILKRMKRRHSRAQAVDAISLLRHYRPDIAIGADLIAGFPTETDVMFANTLNAVEAFGLDLLHVFPFSPRSGAPAAKMPQVAPADIKDRARRLREAGTLARRRFLQRFANADVNVLVEKNGFGHTDHFAPVRVDRRLRPGTVHTLRIVNFDDDALIAKETP